MKIRKLLNLWTPVILWMGVIFAVSAQPSLPRVADSATDKVVKKGGHLTEYAILAVLCRRALRQSRQTKHSAIWAFVMAVLYAISDEWHQTFVPGRNGQPLDVLIDSAGALIGLVAVQRWECRVSGAGDTRRPAPDRAAYPAGTRDTEIAGGTRLLLGGNDDPQQDVRQ
jgi:VanZ family protein